MRSRRRCRACRRRAHAAADRLSHGCRSCRSRRAAVPTTACWCFSSSPLRRRSPPSSIHRLASQRAPPRAGLGLRLSRRRARRPNIPPRASPSRSGAYSARYAFGAREHVDDAARPATCAPGAVDASNCTTSSGRRSTRRSRGAIGCHRRPAERAAVPDHPPLSQPRLRRAGRPACWCLRYGPDPSISPSRCAQMVLVLLLAPLLTGFVRKVKARLLRRRGPPLLQPYRDLSRLDPQGGGARRQRVLAVPCRALSGVRRDLGRGGAGADLRDWSAVQLVRRSDRDHRAARQRAFLPRAGGHGRRDEFRRHRVQPRGDVRDAWPSRR